MEALPREIVEAPSLVPRGKSAIDAHPDRDEIVRVLAEYALTRNDRRISWTVLSAELEAEYGLKLDVKSLQRYVENKVVPAVYVTPEWIKRGVVNGEFDLNTAKMKLELAKKAYEDALGTETVEEVTKDGDVIQRTITPMERAGLMKGASSLIDAAESSMERFGVIPGKKVTVEKKEVKADLRGAMDRMRGRQRPQPIDVDATVTTTTVETTG